MMTPLERRLTDLFIEYTGVSEVARDDDIYDLGADSLLVVRLALHIEREFEVELPTEVFESSGTIAEVAAWIESARRADGRDG